jgi:AAA+ ATPase superfamily predicted ATPase
MFIGRKKEIKMIENRIQSKDFEFGILYGRRRIGKTSLLKKILRSNNGIYFVANEMGYEYNLTILSTAVASFYNESVTFSSLDMLFLYLNKKSYQERVLLIIDEFTYLFTKEPAIQSLLQNAIDTHLVDSNITLILSGSHVGMIEDVISYHKPLYGRTTFKMQIKPFDYYESSMFYPNFNNEDKIRLYSVFGGIPYYLSKINDQITVKANIEKLIIDESAILADETEFFLKQELRSISSYSMIINSICSGATRLNEISTKSQVNNTGTSTKYLNILRNLDIIEKEICFGEKPNSKRTLYKIKDNFFNFYYRFIYTNKSKMILLSPNIFYDNFIAPKLDEYVSFIFEKVAKEFLIRKNYISADDIFYEIARYWGNNKKLKREVEIDIVTKSVNGNTVYECKWTNDLFRNPEVENLKNESEFLNPYRLGGFSKSGYSDESQANLDFAYTKDDLFD